MRIQGFTLPEFTIAIMPAITLGVIGRNFGGIIWATVGGALGGLVCGLIFKIFKSSLSKPVQYTLGISIALAAIVILAIPASSLRPKVKDQLAKICNLENKGLPRQIDAETRLDSIRLEGDKTVIYTYTAVNHAKSEIPLDEFSAQIRTSILDQFQNSPSRKFFKNNDITLHHVYLDKNGELLSDIEITPNQM